MPAATAAARVPAGERWSLGYDRVQPPTQEAFFQVAGLPAVRQGGRRNVLLVVEVTKAIKDKALATFQGIHSAERCRGAAQM